MHLRTLGCVALLLALLSASSGAAEDLADSAGGNAESIYATPQRLIEVEPGRRLNLVCLGEGKTTVLFEAGMGEPTSTWSLVQPRVAKHWRTCSYDREGVGFSDSGTGDGSSARIVDDLVRLLERAEIGPPYLLVAQSYGGMSARLFYYRYPERVAGMVLVEPASEEQGEWFRMVSPRMLDLRGWQALGDEGRALRQRCMTSAEAGIAPGSEDYTACVVDPPAGTPKQLVPAYLEMQTRLAFQRAQGAEEVAFAGASVEQLRRARRSLGDLPLIILTRAPDAAPLRPWETLHLRAARDRVWTNLHRWLADGSSRGEQRIIADASHALHLSHPDAVVQAIEDIQRMISNAE